MKTEFYITTTISEMDIDFIHGYLCNEAYWAKGRTMEAVKKSMKNSLCFGVLNPDGQQVAFARVATDYVVFAWIMDVFVCPAYQGKGIATLLMKFITEHPDLKNINGMGLKTNDAHALYEKFGFKKLEQPEIWMSKEQSNI